VAAFTVVEFRWRRSYGISLVERSNNADSVDVRLHKRLIEWYRAVILSLLDAHFDGQPGDQGVVLADRSPHALPWESREVRVPRT
jgi:hypothetical protein